MSERVCLRCDWRGETDGAACPRCGVPLYRLGGHEPTKPREAARAAPSQPPPVGSRTHRSSVEVPRDDEGAPPSTATPAGRRWVVIVLAFMVAVAGMAFGFIRGDTPDLSVTLGGIEDAPGIATPAPEGAPGTSTTGAPTGPTGPVPCLEQPAGTTGLDLVDDPDGPGPGPEAVSATATADYRFQYSLASSVGTAPDLLEVGPGSSGFTDEAVVGRTVLTFAGGRGLALAPTSGVVDGTVYTIELLFRFDDLGGYRKIVDFKKGSDDNGLYALDGCLNFYPEPSDSATTIEAGSYVLVVLTRDASAKVVGYVNGLRQFSFRDADELAVIDANDTLLFFRDDSVTQTEYSRGRVSRIRLYDRPLSAPEVLGLACAELRISIDPRMCREPAG